MKYTTVIFDLDGTLADTSPGIIDSTRQAERDLGYRHISDQEIHSIIGPPLRDSLSQLYGLTQQQTQEMIAIYRRYYWDTGVLNVKVYEGMAQLLDKLREAGCKVAVATMKLLPYTMKTLEGVGLADRFDAIACYEDEKQPTKADLILQCLGELGVKDKSSAVMIGDSIFDSEGAAQAGVDFIAMTNGFGFEDPAVLKKYPNVLEAGDTRELAQFLGCRYW